ncbi:nonsense-mediated mRNA decay factor SMG5 isoform X2 [Narcine bancroftii]|uniref:nonsense-mediated mRNA decay factor SMG5 isoform X2 n=1 Tax=Narcine bancroftii TaxID=1343680 RepID=UPI003831FA35
MSRPEVEGEPEAEPDAKVLHTKRLYRAVVEAVHRLDAIVSNKMAYQEVFKPENISLRNRLRELCVKLMFLHPVEYGRKAEELLWRKVYYEVIQVVKTNKKHIHSRSALECAYRTHLIAGIGFYQHLLLYVQSHYQLELHSSIDWTHVTDPLIGRRKLVTASGKEMECAQMACHRCLLYLGDLARYQNELSGVDTEQLAERFYYQSLLVAPHVGMPFNQLGTLAGSKYYNVEATYYYLRCIHSEMPFEGAYGNLNRLFDKAAKAYHQICRTDTKKLSVSRQRSRDIKRLLVSFMYLQNLLQPRNSTADVEVTSICQSVLEDFNLCLFYLPSNLNHSGSSEEEEEYDRGSGFLPDLLIFRMMVICLMSVHSLKKTGLKQYSASIAFTLALFSHLVNHVNIRLQAEVDDVENAVPSLQSEQPDELEVKDPSNRGVEPEELPAKMPNGALIPPGKPKGKKYSRLSQLRRRRHRQKADESDLSEGFDSDPSEDSARESERSDSGSAKSDEEEETEAAFDLESDSDMNSQESRSDLEDIEEEPGGSQSGEDPRGPGRGGELVSETARVLCPDVPEPQANGPVSASDATIASNLQALSSQMFQPKRCFRLAPTFSNVMVRPPPEEQAPAPPPEKPCANGVLQSPGVTEHDTGSDSEGSDASSKSVRKEKTPLEKLEILSNEGLLATVKVFLDWLRTNTDIILMCAQSSQSLWNRLSVLLNMLPEGRKMREPGVCVSDEMEQLLNHCEEPDVTQVLLLPEDMALRYLPVLRAVHRKIGVEQIRLAASPLEETVVRTCCIRSFGHFLTRLQKNVLQYNRELGIFISINRSEEETLMEQAQAQFRMAEEEARRNRLMRDMAQLRLQLEVSQLEGSLQQPKNQSTMSPYLIPNTQAICQQLANIRHLANSSRFIIIIPRTVIDGLDFLKKENSGARDAIRFLESEFKKGNRYIRCQRDTGRTVDRHKLKRQDLDAWHLYKILDSCKQLTVSQGSGEEEVAGMVTVLTEFSPDDPASLSSNVQAALQAAHSSGVEIKNILDFYRQWKEMG